MADHNPQHAFRPMLVGLALLLAGCAAAPVKKEPPRSIESQFMQALTERNMERLGSILDGGVPVNLKIEGLNSSLAMGCPQCAALIADKLTLDQATMAVALRSEDPAVIRYLAGLGGRFSDPDILYRLIRDKNDILALAVVDAGEGLHLPTEVTGLRPADRIDTKVVAEKYRQPAMSALYLALESGMYRLAQKLLEAGSDPGLVIHRTPGEDKNVNLDMMQIGERIMLDSTLTFRYPKRTTALVSAVRRQDAKAATMLLDAGAPVAIEGDSRDLDACFFALKVWKREELDLALRMCPWYELHQAAWGGNPADIEAALAKGIDVNSMDYNSDTALHIAVRQNDVGLIKLLVSRNANLNPQGGPYSEPPLHTAASWGNLAALKALIEAGADLSTRNRKGVNALVMANSNGRFEIVDYLRSRGLEYGQPGSSGDNSVRQIELTSIHGDPMEFVLTDYRNGELKLRQLSKSGGLIGASCKLSEVARDARYFHAPSLVRGKTLPRMKPLVTLEDRDLARYEGLVVRVGFNKGVCLSLSLPTAERDKFEVATPEQLMKSMENVEVTGNILQILATGRATMVFPGKLVAIEDAVVTVELESGLSTRCKLHARTRGITYGLQSLFEGVLSGDNSKKAEDVIQDKDIRKQLGKRVKVGPGTGRCEYFEMVGLSQ